MTRAEANMTVAALHDSWRPYLVRYAVRLCGSPALAEDAVQETFLELFRALIKGQRVENERAWTIRVLKRQIGRLRHSDERACIVASAIDDAHEIATPAGQIGALEHDDLYRAMRLLTPREIEVLMLRLEPMKYGEIARELGISTPSVGTFLMRAIRKLRAGMRVPAIEPDAARREAWREPDTLQ